ncbi:hypothetical protein MBLNU230_g3568t1 [Neophaeotheca triangularis]
MEAGSKRKADDDASGNQDKRAKGNKNPWKSNNRNHRGAVQAKVIQPGDSGIWATCNKGKEAKAIGELRDLFAEYADTIYGPELPGTDEATEAAGEESIEDEIQAEIAGIKKPVTAQLFTPVRIDVQCVVFFRTVAPVEPVSLVQKICEDALGNASRKRTRFVKRLSPMTVMGRASPEGLEKVAQEVLRPHFHQDPVTPRTFAIRPTIRNSNQLNRNAIIKQVATAVGPGHRVDLNNYDLLITVEVYQNICGMSVVDNSFERLKRFNLAEIFEPTPKEVIAEALEAPPAETDADARTGASASAGVEVLATGASAEASTAETSEAPVTGMDTS